MAYDKHIWTCGEAITAEKLNHMEDGIASGGGGAGYTCETSCETLIEGSVTTTMEEGDAEAYGELSYSQLIDADSVRVTFDGVEYECPRLGDGSYGAPRDESTGTADWSEYPFELYSDSSDGNILYTETAGTYNIKIEALEYEATHVDPCFKAAVQSGGSVKVSTEKAVQADLVVVRNTSIETIEAGQSSEISLESLTEWHISELAAWGDINSPNGLDILVVPRRIQSSNNFVSVKVYNYGDSAVNIAVGTITANIISFKAVPSACVLLGEGCDDDGGGK